MQGIRRTGRGWEVSASHKGNRKQSVCQTKAEAVKRRKELLEELIRGDHSSAPLTGISDSGITLSDAAARSMADRWAHTKWTETVKVYLNQVLNFLGRETPLMAIDRMDLAAMQQFFIDSGNKPNTVNKKLGVIGAIYKDAIDDRLIPYSPKFPKRLKDKALKDEVFSKEEELLFIAYFNAAGQEEMADLFAFMIDTCCRSSEVRKLKTWDIDYRTKRVTFQDRKANNLGSVPMTRRALAIAQKYSHRNGKMFGINAKLMIEWFNKAKVRLGERHQGVANRPQLTLHCTRHTCATRLAENNISLAMIMTYGGWTSLRSVRRYIHVQVDALMPCVEVLES